MDITVYHEDIHTEVIERFVENILNTKLEFFASQLLEFGFNDMKQIDTAVKRATSVCRSMNIPVKSNFRAVYVSSEQTVAGDWKLSPLARKLVIINGAPSNPFVAGVQIELLKQSVEYVKV